MQTVIVVLLVAAALFFMGRKIYQQYKVGTGCETAGCKACATTSKKDFELPGHLKA